MAMIKCKVIGENEVNGVMPGNTVELDDEAVNVWALEQAGCVEVLDAEVNIEAQTLGSEPVPAAAPEMLPAPQGDAVPAPRPVADETPTS